MRRRFPGLCGGSAGGTGGGGGGPSLDPRILVFEFCSGVILRPAQVALLAKLVGHARGGTSVCHQMLMGKVCQVWRGILAQLWPAAVLRSLLVVSSWSPCHVFNHLRAGGGPCFDRGTYEEAGEDPCFGKGTNKETGGDPCFGKGTYKETGEDPFFG